MDQSDKKWTLSATLLAGAGASLVLVGLYFLFLRPALLPEDVRFMAISEEQMASVGPQLEAWLSQVFDVMGGYVVATGILTMTLAANGRNSVASSSERTAPRARASANAAG